MRGAFAPTPQHQGHGSAPNHPQKPCFAEILRCPGRTVPSSSARMSDKIWEELLVWKLRGPRYDEHKGVELADLAGLVALRGALLDLTRVLWKRRYDKKRLPDLIEERVDLRIQKFEDGCQQTTVWLGKPPQRVLPQTQTRLFDAPDDETSYFDTLHAAAEWIEALLGTLKDGTPPPSWVPREVFQQMSMLGGKRLRTDEIVSVHAVRKRRDPNPYAEFYAGPSEDADLDDESKFQTLDAEPTQTDVPHQQAARTGSSPGDDRLWVVPPKTTSGPSPTIEPPRPEATHSTVPPDRPTEPVLDTSLRARLEELGQPKPQELRVVQRTLSGEVTMVDVDGLSHGDPGRVRLRPDGQPNELLEISFSSEHEQKVTKALYEHRVVRLRVRGEALINERGTIKRFTAKQVAHVSAPDLDLPSEALFERLASEDPPRLIEMLATASLPPPLLTFAAEIAGRRLQADTCVPALLRLLHHEAAVVREGVIYGLMGHPGEEITAEFTRLAEADVSAGVRAAATGALKGR